MTCQHPHCANTVTGRTGARYCSRRCQIDHYRRTYSRRTYITLTLDEHQQLTDLARADGTTVDEVAAELVREGLRR